MTSHARPVARYLLTHRVERAHDPRATNEIYVYDDGARKIAPIPLKQLSIHEAYVLGQFRSYCVYRVTDEFLSDPDNYQFDDNQRA